jgi:pimeloyl-ACP methyl ester carboxylesterase
MAKTTTIAIDGADLHVVEEGNGEPLLLLHGLMGTADDWGHVFDRPALARTYRLVAPDARGHGSSTNPLGEFTFHRCARDVLGIMDRLGIASARAIGMSLGAKTLLHVATASPGRIRAMVLVSAAPRFPGATRAAFAAAAESTRGPEEWAAMRTRHIQGDSQIEALLRLPARFAADLTDMTFDAERLAAVTAKTLVVAGERDPLYPTYLADELHRGIAGSSLWIVPGDAHNPIFGTERAAFVERTLAFLA